MIIFDEREYALGLIKNGFSNFMSLKDLIILARYWEYMNLSTEKVRENLIAFCKKHNPSFNIVKDWKVEKAIKSGKTKKLRIFDDVLVFQDEIDRIRSIDDYKCEKILFVMLVIARFFKSKSNVYYANVKFTEILKLAKVNVDKKTRNALLKKINDTGLIRTTLDGNFEITLATKDGKTVAVVVKDFRDIPSFYPIFCSNCGAGLEKKSPKHRLCKNCYAEKRRREVKKNVEVCRENKKNSKV